MWSKCRRLYPLLLENMYCSLKCTAYFYLFTCVCVCLKVLDWIENHGEAFLSKHTGVGKSLHRARALQKRHEDFEEVAQVSKAINFLFLQQPENSIPLCRLDKKNPKTKQSKMLSW